MTTSSVVDQVRANYAAVARSSLSGSQQEVWAVAEAFGYTPEELATIPADANMGLSCGNPVATAHLRPGEVVVDLGCGGGIDVLLAASKVGPTGKAIGIDMTSEMLDRARRNGAADPQRVAKEPIADAHQGKGDGRAHENDAGRRQSAFHRILLVWYKLFSG